MTIENKLQKLLLFAMGLKKQSKPTKLADSTAKKASLVPSFVLTVVLLFLYCIFTTFRNPTRKLWRIQLNPSAMSTVKHSANKKKVENILRNLLALTIATSEQTVHYAALDIQ